MWPGSSSRRGVKATLLDKEEVLPVAREFLGIDATSIDMVAGDYTVSLPPGPFDLVYFGNVYHIYGPAINAAGHARSVVDHRPRRPDRYPGLRVG